MEIDSIATADIARATVPKSPFPSEADKPIGRMMLRDSFEEVRLFALLLWKFKKPNGSITFLGRQDGDPDGPFKWDFLLEIEGLHIQIIRSVNGLEVWWWGRKVKNEPIERFILYNLKLHAPNIDQTIDSLEGYTLILNPYYRHKRMVTLAHEELQRINPNPPPDISSLILGEGASDNYNDQLMDYYKLVDRQALYSMLLVSEAAFMAEAYLNLMYAIFLRPSIRQNEKLLRESLYRKWTSKIEHLPADCMHISKSPDLGDSRIRNARQLFDLRNRIAHSYPDRSEMKIGKIWFYKRFPVFPTSLPSHKFALALNNQMPSRQEAEFCLKSGEELVRYLRELLDPKFMNEFDMFTESHPIGFNEKKGIYGIPFADFAVMAIRFS